MTGHICRTLMPLASLAEQERYIVHGTHEEYVLPQELLDQAAFIVEAVENGYPWATRLGDGEQAAVLKFGAVLRAEAQEIDLEQDREVLVYHCRSWAAIREEAKACLAALGCTTVEASIAGEHSNSLELSVPCQ